ELSEWNAWPRKRYFRARGATKTRCFKSARSHVYAAVGKSISHGPCGGQTPAAINANDLCGFSRRGNIRESGAGTDARWGGQRGHRHAYSRPDGRRTNLSTRHG